MKSIIYIFIFLATFSSYSQAPIHFDNDEHHTHKLVLDEQLAFAKFQNKKFIKEVCDRFAKKGYDFEHDQCLQNFFIPLQSTLIYSIFEAYEDEKPATTYQALYKTYLTKFDEYINSFIVSESEIRTEYQRRLNSSNPQQVANSAAPNAPTAVIPCSNMDFETGNLAPWVSSGNAGSAYISTVGTDPAVPQINRVFNGNFSGCIDVFGGTPAVASGWRQISNNFTVTNANKNFLFHVALVMNSGGHACNQNPKFEVSLYDSLGTLIPCSNIALISTGNGGVQCSNFTGFTHIGGASTGTDFLNWVPVAVPLTAYVGQNVTIRMRVTRCSPSGHGIRAYVESSCNPPLLGFNGNGVICPGKSVLLTAPALSGFSYNWTSSTNMTPSTSNSISVTMPATYSVVMTNTLTGCQIKLDTAIIAVPSPTANFNYTLSPCLTTFTVPFLNTSTSSTIDPISFYNWDWGDGTVNGTTPSGTHTFSTSVGTKSVELRVTSTFGCSDSITKTFNITPKPVANFNVANNCLSAASNFTSVSTPSASIVSQLWDFGDTTVIGSGANVAHTYSFSNTYNVKLVITNASSCKDSIMKPITVYPKPIITFSANPVCLNTATTFTNTSSIKAPDNISSWAWDFDNNGTSDNTTISPSNTYPTAGNKVVELKATSNRGCKDSALVTIKVNALPIAVFTPSNSCINTSIALNNTSSIPLPDNIASYNWNFSPTGANTLTSVAQNPSNLTYNISGIKTVTLSVLANTGCSAIATRTLNIYSNPTVNFNLLNNCITTVSNFTSVSTPSASIVLQNWNFGDNISGTGYTPTHTYASPNTYTVKLVVTNTNLCKDSLSKPIVIYPKPIVSFSANPVCLNVATTFTNSSTISAPDNIAVWAWDFDNNGIIDDSNLSPTKTYTASGNYFTELKATSNNNCKDSAIVNVKVNAVPTNIFSPTNACINSSILLNNASTISSPDNITSYIWNFGIGANILTSSAQFPSTLSYSVSGVKTITLTTVSNNSCAATVINTITVYSQPIASFSTTAVCQSTASTFTDLSSTSSGVISNWEWDFTANTIIDDNTQNPTFIYPASGTYTTVLIVTNSDGCKDTMALPVNVWGHSIPNFTPSNVCYGTATVFNNLTDTLSNLNVGGATNYSWNFADGSQPTTIFNPTHTYTLGGNTTASYSVVLISKTIHNCVDSMVKPINVYGLPIAAFTSDSVCLGSTSSLVDASFGNGNSIAVYEWDFLSNGTVDVSGVLAPNFIFPNYGANPVSYTVATTPQPGLVCKNATNTITVWVHPSPSPDFTFLNKCVNVQPLDFDASNSTIAIGTNTLYSWSYGDGGTNVGINTNHTYGIAQIYTTTLTVTSNKGCSASIAKQVETYKKPMVGVLNSTACDKQSITFTATTLPNSGVISSWYWDFNNSISTIESTSQITNYIFPGAGSQTVAIVTQTDKGCRDTLFTTIYIDYVPQPIFTSPNPEGCPVHCVTFNDGTLPIPGPAQNIDWKWVLGDGTTIHSGNSGGLTHCYETPSNGQLASYNVKLVVTTDKGCSDSLEKVNFVKVYPEPVAQYIASPNPGDVLSPLIYFTNQSVDYTKWYWTFGDGILKDSINRDPTHYYNSVTGNTYHSVLIVANNYGCRDTAHIPIEIGPAFTFYIPNAFTPGENDNLNNIFTGMGIGIAKYEMWVFDRWGETIFYTDDIYKGWNGKVQGNSEYVQQDVYVWKVKLKDIFGKKHDYVGHVTLLK